MPILNDYERQQAKTCKSTDDQSQLSSLPYACNYYTTGVKPTPFVNMTYVFLWRAQEDLYFATRVTKLDDRESSVISFFREITATGMCLNHYYYILKVGCKKLPLRPWNDTITNHIDWRGQWRRRRRRSKKWGRRRSRKSILQPALCVCWGCQVQMNQDCQMGKRWQTNLC